jgi:tetratricopeptide (TPR) repeat protein
VWEVVRRDDRTVEEYREALRKARLICRHDVNHHVYRTTLGMALYRMGDYEQALAAFERSREIAREPDPYNHAYSALAHHHLGRTEEARAALARLREIVAAPPYVLYGGMQDLLHKVELLIDPDPETGDAEGGSAGPV